MRTVILLLVCIVILFTVICLVIWWAWGECKKLLRQRKERDSRRWQNKAASDESMRFYRAVNAMGHLAHTHWCGTYSMDTPSHWYPYSGGSSPRKSDEEIEEISWVLGTWDFKSSSSIKKPIKLSALTETPVPIIDKFTADEVQRFRTTLERLAGPDVDMEEEQLRDVARKALKNLNRNNLLYGQLTEESERIQGEGTLRFYLVTETLERLALKKLKVLTIDDFIKITEQRKWIWGFGEWVDYNYYYTDAEKRHYVTLKVLLEDLPPFDGGDDLFSSRYSSFETLIFWLWAALALLVIITVVILWSIWGDPTDWRLLWRTIVKNMSK